MSETAVATGLQAMSQLIDEFRGVELPDLPEGLSWEREVVTLPVGGEGYGWYARVCIVRQSGVNYRRYIRPGGGEHLRSIQLAKLGNLNHSQRADLIYDLGTRLVNEYEAELHRFGPRPVWWKRLWKYLKEKPSEELPQAPYLGPTYGP